MQVINDKLISYDSTFNTGPVEKFSQSLGWKYVFYFYK